MSLTREEAIENHRKMWNWLADQYEQGRMVFKEDYFKEVGISRFSKSHADCFLCEYVNNINLSTRNRVFCSTSCPLRQSGDFGGTCSSMGSEFSSYCSYLTKCDTKNLAIIARKIANLPERIGQNEL